LYVWIGGTIGNILAFLVGKILFTYWAVWFTSNFKVMSILSKTISKNSWKIMFLLRISPIMPYNVLNYSLAMVKNISIISFGVTGSIGMLPGSLLYVYFGSITRDLSELFSGNNRESSIQWILIGIGLVIAIFVVVLTSVISVREIRKEMKKDENDHHSNETSPLLFK